MRFSNPDPGMPFSRLVSLAKLRLLDKVFGMRFVRYRTNLQGIIELILFHRSAQAEYTWYTMLGLVATRKVYTSLQFFLYYGFKP